MELTARLLQLGYTRPRVLLVPAPGGDTTRRAAQSELDQRRWALAVSPADADVLLTCGTAGPELREAVERAWQQLPGPRARAVAASPQDLRGVLDDCRRQLRDLNAQREDARQRPATPAGDLPHDQEGDDGGGAQMDMDTDMGDDMGDDMGMEMPAGLMMAGTGPDRDGLQLDELHVQLGPVLPDWPPALVAELTVQGDVVRSAQLHVLDDEEPTREPTPVDRLDRAAAVLALAGAGGHARTARRLRDDPDRDRQAISRLHDAVARDRVLRWSLRGLGTLTGGELWAQLLALLGPEPLPEPPSLDAAGDGLAGAELSAVRLAVACTPPRTPVPARA